uniref:Ion transport domain-containing protein n=1 Tax=Haptolina brevifila TaxID=156173 RepID=A0A7S2CGW5_9EUKA
MIQIDKESGVLGSMRGLMDTIVFLFEIMLGSSNQIQCFRESAHPMTGALFMDSFLVLAVLLGTNMLIALMAKTFDIIYEQQETNYLYLTALTTVAWQQAPVVPPPLALLGLPYLAMRCFCFSPCPCSKSATTYEKHTAEEGDELPNVPALMRKMEKYLVEHEGDQGEDDKWRTRLATKLAAIHTKLEEQSKDLEKVGALVSATNSRPNEPSESWVRCEKQMARLEEQVGAQKEMLAAHEAKIEERLQKLEELLVAKLAPLDAKLATKSHSSSAVEKEVLG